MNDRRYFLFFIFKSEFKNHNYSQTQLSRQVHFVSSMALHSVVDDEDDTEPGQMRVSEIKAELTMRKVDFGDCFDKESLVQRLTEARLSGKGDPSIIDDFNKQKVR